MDETERARDEDELAERGRLLVARAVAETRAPQGLRERIEADRAAAARPRRRPGALAWLAGAVAAAAVVAAVVIGADGGATHAPSVLAVAQASAAPPTAGPPRHVDDGYLAARVGDVRFPDWRDVAWPATGQRTGVVGGRMVRTVVYAAPDGTPAWYSVVDGAPLKLPAGAQARRVDGTTYHVLTNGAHRIVTWRRGGHTCVLRAPKSVPASRLVALASWEPT
jgi:hypothetical protein